MMLARPGRASWHRICSCRSQHTRHALFESPAETGYTRSQVYQCRRNVHSKTSQGIIGLQSRRTRSSRHDATTTSRAFSVSTRARHNPDPASASSLPTSSVSSAEVEHFSRLASSWWDPHGPSRLLHLMNPLRFDFLRRLTHDRPAQQYDYLDIGCGGGIFASAAARHPSSRTVTAIDPTPACIAVAQAQQRRDPALRPPKLNYLNTALEDLPPGADNSLRQFDIITLFEVLEHISDPSAFLLNAAKHLRPGGWIVGSTIARHPLSYITTKLIAEAPIIGVVPPGTHDWNQYINPPELAGWFEKQNEAAVVDADFPAPSRWGPFSTQGVVYVPALGWRVVDGSEAWGNYFFGVQKLGSYNAADAEPMAGADG
jgi:polyprenyldihydroxybenzoate methyltransferase / 3-demethylubiquinol 3-O-methyltransferase